MVHRLDVITPELPRTRMPADTLIASCWTTSRRAQRGCARPPSLSSTGICCVDWPRRRMFRTSCRSPWRLGSTDVLVRFHQPFRPPRLLSRLLQEAMPPAKCCRHRHSAVLRRLPHHKWASQRHLAMLVMQSNQRRAVQGMEGLASLPTTVARQSVRLATTHRAAGLAVPTAPLGVHLSVPLLPVP